MVKLSYAVNELPDFYQRASASVANPDAKTPRHESAPEERNHADTLLKRTA